MARRSGGIHRAEGYFGEGDRRVEMRSGGIGEGQDQRDEYEDGGCRVCEQL